MNRYQTNEEFPDATPIGIGMWALIPVGLFLVVVVSLSQYGLDRLLRKNESTQPGDVGEPAVNTTPTISQRQLLQNSIGMTLTLLPAGELSIKASRLSVNVPGPQTQTQHLEIPHSFFMGTCEVTNEQYYQVMKSLQHQYKSANRPATKVQWSQAVEFCRRLSAIEAEQQLGNVYRLPTELEWEYACRAGTRTAYSFPGTAVKLMSHGWFASNANGTSHAVGTRKANPWGLFDMHGNVWEWCADPFHFAARSNGVPSLLTTNELRVRRGGGWLSLAEHCRSDVRRGLAADRALADVGFRVVMTRSQTPAQVATTGDRPPTPAVNRNSLLEIPPEPTLAVVQIASADTAAAPPNAGSPPPASDSRTAPAQTPTPQLAGPTAAVPTPPIVKKPALQTSNPRQAKSNRPQTLPARDYLINSIGITMRRVTAGVWTSANPQLEDVSTDTTRSLNVEQPFYVGIHEVTQEQFQLIMGTNPSRFRSPDHPVETVDWYAAESFCKKLSALDEEISAGRSYRLPTETEWEYCCRASESSAATTPTNRDWLNLNFWCANNSGQRAINAANFFQTAPQHYPDLLLSNGCRTHPVGQKQPNRWSLFDMRGNVWEWCSNVPSSDSNAERGKRSAVSIAPHRIIRGGSWYDVPNLCQPSSRTKLAPDDEYDNVGFRIVCDQATNPPR
ncbi:MAG: SUMF1/EgtB/PvdO family nonheme iron enzyme [Planctomycetota bacterium]|nr:SUMF1/EgtB/PvdO family nonheme iron enzyme [Planctomycetota bacterium]